MRNAEWQMIAAGTPDPGTAPSGSTCNTTGIGNTVETGSRPECVSNWGVHDMVGNVWEWVADCYEEDAYETHEDYPAMVGSWLDSCYRVLRGGSWYSIPRYLRSAYRGWDPPDVRNNYVGFRVARTL